MTQVASRGAARQKRHERIRLRLAGTAGAAAPGRLPQPQPHLRPGHRRRGRPDARRGLVASRRSSRGAEQTKTDEAKAVGRLVAERAQAAGVEQVVFDRAGFRYHGRIKSLADAAREAGLDF